MPYRVAKQIHNKLLSENNFILVTHKNPDGDAIGSVSAVAHYLKSLNKKVGAFYSTQIPNYLNFLTIANEIKKNEEIWFENEFPIIITLDCSNLEHSGIEKYLEKLTKKPFIINIDHHKTNDNFGDLNLVIPNYSSTAEILFFLFKTNNLDFDKLIATSLLTGIVSDTDNFSNGGASSQALKTAGYLVEKGGNLKLIKSSLFDNKTLPILKFWGVVLSRLNKNEKFDIAYTYLTKQDIKEHQVNDDHAEGLANLLNHLDENRIAMLLKERNDNIIKVSLRTTRDDIDVSEIAQKFGGGGHQKASGFSVTGTINQALEKIWQILEKDDRMKG